MATVGYGDLSPRSLFGQLLASHAAEGILVIALPITVGQQFLLYLRQHGQQPVPLGQEHAPTDAVAPERIVATSHGSSTKFLAHHGVLNQPGRRVGHRPAVRELLPCTRAPKRKAANGNDGANARG